MISIADIFAWQVDVEKSRAHAPGNIYAVSARTGNRKVIVSPDYYQPIDYEWLAQTADKGFVQRAPLNYEVFSKEELLARAERSRKPKPPYGGSAVVPPSP